jgi:hypothetical protein
MAKVYGRKRSPPREETTVSVLLLGDVIPLNEKIS